MEVFNGRREICLNGFWDFQMGRLECKDIPTDWQSQKILVPSPWNINAFAAPHDIDDNGQQLFLRGGEYNLFPEYPKEWESAKCGWYQREFFVSKEDQGKNITLCFNGVLFCSDFYINGVHVHSDTDGFLPIEFDVSHILNYGQNNVITVFARTYETMKFFDKKDKIEYPTGSFWGMNMGGIWQDVFLKIYPSTYIDDIFVKTDIQNHVLNAHVSITGCHAGDRVNFILKATDDSLCFDLGTVVVDQTGKLEFVYDYGDIKQQIKLWQMHEPALYYLEISLMEGDQVIDSKTQRFGFKSFGIKGEKFYLNGTPINLRNDSWHYMGFAYQTREYAKAWYEMAREANVNCIRLHAQVYPEFFLDIADEMGMLIIDETSIWASHCNYHYSMKFVEIGKKHVQRLVRRDRNHPSVIIWSVENECTMAYRVSADHAVKDEDELCYRLAMLEQTAHEMDPTRPISGDGSGDMGGRAAIYSMHYPGKTCDLSPGKPITIGEMGSSYFSTPDCVCNLLGAKTYLSFDNRVEAIGRDVYESLKSQRKWAAQTTVFNVVWYGLKPLPFKESIRSYDDYTTPGVKPTKIGAYISTLNAGYDDSLPDYEPNPLFKWVRRAYMPECFFVEQGRVRYYGGEKGKINISVHNDSLYKENYSISWSLHCDENVLEKGNLTIEVAPSEYKYADICFTAPYAKEIDICCLQIDMRAGDRAIVTEQLEIKAYNKNYFADRIKSFGKTVLMGCTDRKTEEFLTSVGIKVNDDGEFDNILATHSIEPDCRKSANLIYLSIENTPFASWMIHKSPEKAFINADLEILGQNLCENDLEGWESRVLPGGVFDDYVSTNAQAIITTGKGEPLVYAFSDENMIVSALDILNCIQVEPAALVLLSNLIDHVGRRRTKVYEDCLLISRTDSPLANFLKTLGVQFRVCDVQDKHAVMSVRNERLVIADGAFPLDYLDQFLPINAKSVVIWGGTQLPTGIKGRFDIQHTGLNQLVVTDQSHWLSQTLHQGNLYGLESGDEVALAVNPVYIKDAHMVEGILENSPINWRFWNHQGEDKKIISITRNEMEQKVPVYGLARTRLNLMDIIVCRLNFSVSSNKLKKLATVLLSNLSVKICHKEYDEYQQITSQAVYQDGVCKALLLKADEKQQVANLTPGLNANQNGHVWRLCSMGQMPQGIYYYGLFVYSPTDRTDLLLNPDLAGVTIENGSYKQLYLNGEKVATGERIHMNALRFKAGINEFIVMEDRKDADAGGVSIKFSRKDNHVLDLKFSLESGEFAQLEHENWTFDSNFNKQACANAVMGKGHYWHSGQTQRKGMYFEIDFNETKTVSRLQFNSKIKGQNVDRNTPVSFSIFALGQDGYQEFYTAESEDGLSFIDGKVILNFAPQKASKIKIVMNSVALKPLSISELKIFG